MKLRHIFQAKRLFRIWCIRFNLKKNQLVDTHINILFFYFSNHIILLQLLSFRLRKSLLKQFSREAVQSSAENSDVIFHPLMTTVFRIWFYGSFESNALEFASLRGYSSMWLQVYFNAEIPDRFFRSFVISATPKYNMKIDETGFSF